MKDILKQTAKLNSEDRRLLIVALLAQQRRKVNLDGRDYVREFCSLIDLSTGVVVGSGWCEKCQGTLGRGEG